MDKEKIRKALDAASKLMVVEVWAPPVHQFEIDRRYEARSAVQKLCLEALIELNKQDA